MFTKTQLETLEVLVTEALGNRKRAEKEISKREQAVFVKLMALVANGGNSRSYTKGGVEGNEYIDGSYRLWKQPNGSIGIKLDKQNELYNFPKDIALYDRMDDLFDRYGSPEIKRYEQEREEYREMERGADNE